MNSYPLTIFHDGHCPICRFEVTNLQARNDAGLLRFVDIAAEDFDPSAYGGTLDAFRARIHGLRPDGSFVTGMEVFRLAYRAVGLGWVAAPTAWGPLRRPADALYGLFARHRSRFSRHLGFIFEGLVAWQAAHRAAACRRSACSLERRP